MSSAELIFASDYPEFFYKEDDSVVFEGNPVGVEIDKGNIIDFILFDDIYWQLDLDLE